MYYISIENDALNFINLPAFLFKKFYALILPYAVISY